MVTPTTSLHAPSKDGCDDAGSCMSTPISSKVVREMAKYRFSYIFTNSFVAPTSDASYLLGAFIALASIRRRYLKTCACEIAHIAHQLVFILFTVGHVYGKLCGG